MISVSSIDNCQTSKIGFFRFKKFDADTYLLTNDVGRYAFLSVKEFEDFIAGKSLDAEKYEYLEKNGFIQDERYQDRVAGSYAIKNQFIGTGPTLHMIVTTLRCNHHCKYCHAAVAPMTATDLDMTQETADKVLETIFYTNSHGLTIEFQGGESLVNWDIVKYFVEQGNMRAQFLKKSVSYALVTNLTLMTEEKLDWLLDNHVYLSTSLDGDEVNHNKNRTGYDGNSFEKVTYWIKRINQRYEDKGEKRKIGALLTLTKENLKDYKNIINSYVDIGLDSIFLRWLNPYGFAASDLKTLMYDEDEWIDMYKNALDYIIDLNKAGTPFRESMTLVYLKKILAPNDPSFMDIRSPSGIAIGGVAYNYDGKVYASDESRMLARMGIQDFLMSDIKETGVETYRNMMNSDITKIAVQASCLDGLPGFNDHVYKPFIGVDIIHNFKVTGNIYSPMMADKKFKIQVAILDYIFDKLRDPEVKKIFESWISNK